MDHRNNRSMKEALNTQEQERQLMELLGRHGLAGLFGFPEPQNNEDYVQRRHRLVQTFHLDTSRRLQPPLDGSSRRVYSSSSLSSVSSSSEPLGGGRRRQQQQRRRHSAPPYSVASSEWPPNQAEQMLNQRQRENLRLNLGEALICLDSFDIATSSEEGRNDDANTTSNNNNSHGPNDDNNDNNDGDSAQEG